MNDLEKFRYLIDNNIIPTQYNTYKSQCPEVLSMIIDNIAYKLEKYLLNLKIEITLNTYMTSKTPVEKWRELFREFRKELRPFETLIKKLKINKKEVFQKYFGSEDVSLFSYVSQNIKRTSANHFKLTEVGESFHIKCREAISEITNISIHILQETNKQDFCRLVMLDIENSQSLLHEDLPTSNQISSKFGLALCYEDEITINSQVLDRLEKYFLIYINDLIEYDNAIFRYLSSAGYHVVCTSLYKDDIHLHLSLVNHQKVTNFQVFIK